MLKRIASNLKTKMRALSNKSPSNKSSLVILQNEIKKESKALRNMHLSDAKRLESIERLEAVLERSSEHDLPELRRLCAQAVLQPLVSSEDESVVIKAAKLITSSDNSDARNFLHRVIEITSHDQKRFWLLNL